MGQESGKLPDIKDPVECPNKVTADAIQRKIRELAKGTEFATSSDADLLRAASRWVSSQPSWVLCDLQLAVYGETDAAPWVFYAGSRSNQVAFHTGKGINEPEWERKGWKTWLYDGAKMGLKIVGQAMPAIVEVASKSFPSLRAPLFLAGIAATNISDSM